MSENEVLQKAQDNMIAEIIPFQEQSQELKAKAEAQEVTNESQLASAVAVKKQITAHRKLVTDTRLGITRRFDDVKKAIMNKEAEILLPLDEGQTILGQKMLTYTEEQERIKAEEKARVDRVVARFEVPNPYLFKDVDSVQDEGERFKRMYKELTADDQTNPTIKAAFSVGINRLSDRKDYLIEQKAQEEEKARLEAQAAEQSAAQAEIDKQKSENEAKARKIAAEKERLDRETQRKADEDAAAKAEAERKAADNRAVKTGVRTITTFEVTEPWLVPREYCEPVDKLIHAAIAEGKTVPGVVVKTEKRI